MKQSFNCCRLFFSGVLSLAMISQVTAQQAPLKKVLDSFYFPKDQERRLEIYNESLKNWPDTGKNHNAYNFARSTIAIAYAEANNLPEAQQWMKQITEQDPEGRFSATAKTKLDVAAIMIKKGDTTYGISQLQPWIDSLYKVVASASTGKYPMYYNPVMVVYTPVLNARREYDKTVKYLTPFYNASKQSFGSDRESVMRTPKDKYDLQKNLSVQYAKALAATGDNKAAIQVLSTMQTSGLYDQEKLSPIINSYAGNVKGNYANKVLDSLKKSNLDRLAKFQQYKKDIDGKQIDLKAAKAKYVLLDFWGSWCHPCRASHPHLKEVYAEYKAKGFEIIGIAQEMSKDTTVQRTAWTTAVKEDGLTWRQVLNNENGKQFDAVTAFGVTAFPTKILLDSDGNIVATFIGNTSGNELGIKLHELLDK